MGTHTVITGYTAFCYQTDNTIDDVMCYCTCIGLICNFYFQVSSCHVSQIQVYAGLYHGSEALCKAESTRNVQQEVVDLVPVWNWNENIEFTINVQ